MSSYASLTGARPTGVFDSLFVRNQPGVGPFVSVLGLGAAAPAVTALENGLASVQSDLATKRDVSDSFSQQEIEGLLDTQAATRYTKVEANELFRTEVDAVAALASKRSIADSLSTSETTAFLATNLTKVYTKAEFHSSKTWRVVRRASRRRICMRRRLTRRRLSF